MDSGIDYEFRTTVVKELISSEDFKEIGKLIQGAELYVLQKFIPSKTLDQKFMNSKTIDENELEKIRMICENFVKKCIVR